MLCISLSDCFAVQTLVSLDNLSQREYNTDEAGRKSKSHSNLLENEKEQNKKPTATHKLWVTDACDNAYWKHHLIINMKK